jgi:hypothetical protein
MYFGKYFIQDQYDYHTINLVFYMPFQKLAAFFLLFVRWCLFT